MAVFIGLWSCLYTTKLKSVIRHNLGHSKAPHCGGANMNIGPKKCKFPRTYNSQQLEANTTVESKTMPTVCCNVNAHLRFCVSDASGF